MKLIEEEFKLKKEEIINLTSRSNNKDILITSQNENDK